MAELWIVLHAGGPGGLKRVRERQRVRCYVDGPWSQAGTQEASRRAAAGRTPVTIHFSDEYSGTEGVYHKLKA